MAMTMDAKVWTEAARAILLGHAHRYPLMQVQDLYKLIHQASFANEHAIENPEAALRRLNEEWAAMGQGPAEPIFDVISPDGGIVRVHLRPYAANGGTVERLFRAFMTTAAIERAGEDAMRRLAVCAMSLAEQGCFAWPARKLCDFLKSCEEQGWPAAHHSPVYHRAYRPAYRVVLRGLLS
jgi:hypothetical protein